MGEPSEKFKWALEDAERDVERMLEIAGRDSIYVSCEYIERISALSLRMDRAVERWFAEHETDAEYL